MRLTCTIEVENEFEETRAHMTPAARQPVAVPGREDDVRILAVEDHSAFLEALTDLIAAAPGFVLVGEASSGEEALSAAEQLVPDLVLMDVAMPGMGGIAATRAIRRRQPGVRVILISVDDPALHPALGELTDVVYSRKQDLAPLRLRQLWERASAPRASASSA